MCVTVVTCSASRLSRLLRLSRITLPYFNKITSFGNQIFDTFEVDLQFLL